MPVNTPLQWIYTKEWKSLSELLLRTEKIHVPTRINCQTQLLSHQGDTWQQEHASSADGGLWYGQNPQNKQVRGLEWRQKPTLFPTCSMSSCSCPDGDAFSQQRATCPHPIYLISDRLNGHRVRKEILIKSFGLGWFFVERQLRPFVVADFGNAAKQWEYEPI